MVGNNPLYRGTDPTKHVELQNVECDEEADTTFRLHSLHWGHIQQKPIRQRKTQLCKARKALPKFGSQDHTAGVQENARPALMATELAPSRKSVMTRDNNDTLGLDKFTKMLTMGVPVAAVHFKMRQEGLDPADLESTRHAAPLQPPVGIMIPVASPPPLEGLKLGNTDSGGILMKYERMLALGIPRAAVLHKLKADGLEEHLVGSFQQPAQQVASTSCNTGNKMVGGSFTQPASDAGRCASSSIDVAQLKAQFTQPKEITSLSSSGPKPVPNIHTTSATAVLPLYGAPRLPTSKAFGSCKVSLLDHKRSTNAGIALAKIRVSGDHVAEMLMGLTTKIVVDAKVRIEFAFNASCL
jgi:hypothetical protein